MLSLSLGTTVVLDDCVFVLLAFADIDMGFTQCNDKASVAVLCGWVSCFVIPGCFILPET